MVFESTSMRYETLVARFWLRVRGVPQSSSRRLSCAKENSSGVENAMTRERGSPAESKNCVLPPTADRRFYTKVKCPTGRASFWVKFPHCTELHASQMPGDCPGGGGGGWAVLELTYTLSL